MERAQRVLILGAAGRDFHDFNVHFRGDPRYVVVAFTATQIPQIEGRTYPPELAGDGYPNGIPIRPESELEALIHEHSVDLVVFSYSDVTHEHVMHLASRALAAGADFRLMGTRSTQLRSQRPVVSVCAVRTGCGKSQTARRAGEILRGLGRRVAVVRHPMPYGDLGKQAVQRFATAEDLLEHDCTIEEREEYEPYIELGIPIFAGVDYGAILREAEEEADVIVWDGGNNDLPFYRPDLHIVVADPLRVGHESSYHPGETNARAADVFVINKIDSASPEAVQALREGLRALNPTAQVIRARSPVTVEDVDAIRNKRVLVVEDGPTLTHGGLATGAGAVAAQRAGVEEIVDPRPYAVGTIAETFRAYPNTGPVLPAMGYSPMQREELERTIRATPADVVVIGTPIDLGRIIELDKPSVRVRYELSEVGEPTLEGVLREWLEQ